MLIVDWYVARYERDEHLRNVKELAAAKKSLKAVPRPTTS